MPYLWNDEEILTPREAANYILAKRYLDPNSSNKEQRVKTVMKFLENDRSSENGAKITFVDRNPN